jgi:sulfur relay (sulfurtransferase) DsrF/TusC family protein
VIVMEKKIVILISSSPFGTLNNYEALRSSIAFYDHSLQVIWADNGVFFTLDSTDKTMTRSFLRLASDLGINLLVVDEDLAERGLRSSQLMPEVQVINKGEYIDALTHADVVLSF